MPSRKRSNWRQPTVFDDQDTGGRRTTRAARQSAASSSHRSSSQTYATTKDGVTVNVSRSKERVQKWIEVWRPPASGVGFAVPIWVPVDKLTPEERLEYLPTPPTAPENTEQQSAEDTATQQQQQSYSTAEPMQVDTPEKSNTMEAPNDDNENNTLQPQQPPQHQPTPTTATTLGGMTATPSAVEPGSQSEKAPPSIEHKATNESGAETASAPNHPQTDPSSVEDGKESVKEGQLTTSDTNEEAAKDELHATTHNETTETAGAAPNAVEPPSSSNPPSSGEQVEPTDGTVDRKNDGEKEDVVVNDTEEEAPSQPESGNIDAETTQRGGDPSDGNRVADTAATMTEETRMEEASQQIPQQATAADTAATVTEETTTEEASQQIPQQAAAAPAENTADAEQTDHTKTDEAEEPEPKRQRTDGPDSTTA